MTFEEYFGGWVRVIDIKELNKVVGQVRVIDIEVSKLTKEKYGESIIWFQEY